METNSKFKNFLLSKTEKIALIAFLYVFIWVGAAISAEVFFWLPVFVIGLTYFGWKALNKITPEIF